jgi:hypothetical protein
MSMSNCLLQLASAHGQRRAPVLFTAQDTTSYLSAHSIPLNVLLKPYGVHREAITRTEEPKRAVAEMLPHAVEDSILGVRHRLPAHVRVDLVVGRTTARAGLQEHMIGHGATRNAGEITGEDPEAISDRALYWQLRAAVPAPRRAA